jgi:hypothetical protein
MSGSPGVEKHREHERERLSKNATPAGLLEVRWNARAGYMMERGARAKA